MMHLALLVCFLFSPPFLHASKVPEHTIRDKSFKPPKWYHGYDGPIFGVEETVKDMERRSYHPSVWASTNFTDVSFSEAYNQGVKRLESYWGGKNVPEKQIAETVPTFIQLYITKEENKMKLKSKFTVEYFVPHELHATPPAPSEEAVNVIKLPQEDVWVRAFGGYASADDVEREVFDFLDDLDEVDIRVRKDLVGVAFYDKPYHVLGRHNEVWAWPEKGVSEATVTQVREGVQQKMEAILSEQLRG